MESLWLRLDGKGHFTLELEGTSPMIYKFSHWLEKSGKVHVRFTLELRSKGTREFDWMRNLNVALHGNQ